jgi:hypothetical protein
VEVGCKVWCDALCINQGSIPERNSEIKRMRDLYRAALNVVIWLGDAADGSDDAINFVNGISQARSEGQEALRDYLRGMFASQGTYMGELIKADYSTILLSTMDYPGDCYGRVVVKSQSYGGRKQQRGQSCIRSIILSTFPESVIPDYESSVREAHTAFATTWIETEGTLELLTQCGESGENYKRDQFPPGP